MSPPPHREKDAKVEGRDPPEKAKDTMTTFRGLMSQLLKVRPEEVREQQSRIDNSVDCRPDKPRGKGAKMIAAMPGVSPKRRTKTTDPQ